MAYIILCQFYTFTEIINIMFWFNSWTSALLWLIMCFTFFQFDGLFGDWYMWFCIIFIFAGRLLTDYICPSEKHFYKVLSVGFIILTIWGFVG